ncbi:MAG: transcriptional regulator [bacterium]|nr:transcriptional regulator [bacterium]
MQKQIDALQRIAATRAGVIGLGGGLPSDELFPRAALARAFVRAMREPQASALQYAWPEGREELRKWIAARLRARGADVSADEVIVTSGAQQALAIAAQLCFGRGEGVGVDPETYPAALDLFRTRGGALRVGWEGDVRCFYAMPAIGNPRSRPMADADRRALLARDIHILEDDAYADLRFDGGVSRPLLAHDRAHVWHVGSFSKTLCPGLRVGWLVPPPTCRERATEVKHATDLQASSLGQAVLELFLAGDDFDARLARARRFYRSRAARLVRAVRRHLPAWRCDEPEGGFALFVESQEPGDDLALLEVATRNGVSFDPGRMFRPDNGIAPLAIRLCFSYTRAGDLDEGARRLAVSWDEYRRDRDRTANEGTAAGRDGSPARQPH